MKTDRQQSTLSHRFAGALAAVFLAALLITGPRPTPALAAPDSDLIEQAALQQVAALGRDWPCGGPFELGQLTLDKDWAFLTVVCWPEAQTDPEVFVPSVILFALAHHDRQAWQVSLEKTEAFDAALRQAPDSLLDPVSKEKLALVASSGASQTAASLAGSGYATGLPWQAGTTWYYRTSIHGPYHTKHELDFASSCGTIGEVRAADSGIVEYATETCMTVRREDGLTIGYQHIRPSDIAQWQVGESVAAGDPLGKTTLQSGCSGWSEAHHVHFWLKDVDADGSALGGWRIDGEWMRKDGVDRYPNLGCIDGSNDLLYIPEDMPLLETHAGSMELVSYSSAGFSAGGGSAGVDLSRDGRYVVYASGAANIVANDTNGETDIFVFDRYLDSVERVNVADEGEQANDGSGLGSISEDGRYVVFDSYANNLVAGDNNGHQEVFLHDRLLHTTVLVSLSSSGEQANADCYRPFISADGRYVAFTSTATNLDPPSNGRGDVFLRDLSSGTTKLITRGIDGQSANQGAGPNAISQDGRFVVFSTNASNLVPGDTNGVFDAFVYDRESNTIERVSVTASGGQLNRYSEAHGMSADGRFVAFRSSAGVLGGPWNGRQNIYVRDRLTPTTDRITLGYDGSAPDLSSYYPAVSDDGRYVAYMSEATNLVTGDANGKNDVFVTDRDTDQTWRISMGYDGSEADGGPGNSRTVISGDGRFVLFSSSATNMVPGDINASYDAFVYGLYPVPFGVLGLEVTQGIQCYSLVGEDPSCPNNSVPLVAGKPTAVRVYVASSSDEGVPVQGELLVDDGNGFQQLLPVNQNMLAPKEPIRDDDHHALRFELPQSMWTGSLSLYARVWAADERRVRYPANGEMAVSFGQSASLSIGYVSIDYLGASPDQAAISAAQQYLQTVYPLSQVTYFPVPSIESFTGPVSNTLLLNYLNELDAHYEISGWPQPNGRPDQLFGWVPSGTWVVPGSPWEGGGASDPCWLEGGKSRVAFGADSNINWSYQVIMAHEMAHNLGRLHPQCANEHPDPDWPYADYAIQEVGIDFGFYPRVNPLVLAETDDLMVGAWCQAVPYNDKWISPYTFSGLYEGIPILLDGGCPYDPVEPGLLGAAQADQAVLLVSGQAGNDGSAEFFRTYQLTTTQTITQPIGSAYCLALEDGSGGSLSTDCFDLSFTNPETGEPLSAAAFVRILPFDAAAVRLVLKQGETVLAEEVVSAHAPVITLLTPNGGGTLSGDVNVTWTAGDADGNDLVYAVSYSADGGQTWQHLAIALTSSSLLVSTNLLQGSTQGLFRVMASDGIHTATDASDATFTVVTHAPTATILSPADGLTVITGQTLLVQGSGYDLEDGTLDDAALSWASDLTGTLGTGRALAVSGLAAGIHHITLTATDSEAQIGQASVTVEIVDPAAPEVTIALAGDDLTLSWSAVSGATGYRVYRSFLPDFVPDAPVAEVTDPGFADTGRGAGFEDAYYRVSAFFDLGGESAFSSQVGKVMLPVVPGWNLLAWPLLPASGALDSVLGTQLHGTANPDTADRVLVWDPASQSYESAWFCGGAECEALGEPYMNHWLADDSSPSTLVLEPDMGFWVQNQSGTAEMLMMAGAVADADRVVLVEQNSQLLGSAFPDARPLHDAGLPATGGDSPETADRVLYWDSARQTYQSAWYCGGAVCEGWGEPWANHWLANDYSPTAIVLEPGHGFLYVNRFDPFTWTNPRWPGASGGSQGRTRSRQ